MNPTLLFALCFGIGVIAGLRSLTAPAVTSWVIHLRGLGMRGSHLTFMSTLPAAIIFTVFAIVEIVNDKLPKTPSRTTAVPFSVRILTGFLSGASASVAGGGNAYVGGGLGVVGAIVGTYGGYFARTGAVKALHVPDFVIALVEDAVAIVGGFLLMSQLP
jgi:uncharacterized membrane protein